MFCSGLLGFGVGGHCTRPEHAGWRGGQRGHQQGSKTTTKGEPSIHFTVTVIFTMNLNLNKEKDNA